MWSAGDLSTLVLVSKHEGLQDIMEALYSVCQIALKIGIGSSCTVFLPFRKARPEMPQ